MRHVRNRAAGVFQGDGGTFGAGWFMQGFTCRELVGDMSENPGLAEGRAANHHAIAAGEGDHAAGVGGITDIAVAEDRDIDGLFHLTDYVPISVSLEALFG